MKGGRKTRRKSRRGIIPRPVAKGVRDINKITSRIARGIDKYPLAALEETARVVLKRRSMPKLKIGGSYTEKKIRSLGGTVFSDLAGSVVPQTQKKGGRRRRRRRRRRKRSRRGRSRRR